MLRRYREFVCMFAALICGIAPFAADAQGGVWVTKTPMPVPRSHVMAAGIEGKFYVVGGINTPVSGFIPLDKLELYDPVTDTWTTKAAMHDARDAAGSAVIGNKLYVAGGQSASGDTATLEVYDPLTDTWTTKASMPSPDRRGRIGACVYTEISAHRSRTWASVSSCRGSGELRDGT